MKTWHWVLIAVVVYFVGKRKQRRVDMMQIAGGPPMAPSLVDVLP